MAPAWAQRAQLPRKGRTPDNTPARPLEPIRRLPRKDAAGAERVYRPSPLDEYIRERRAAMPGPRALPDDRSRPLVRQIPSATPPPPLVALDRPA
ncbi:MAG: hypothetical protein ACRD96_12410, partial [Bryobacteraceae bacterium]